MFKLVIQDDEGKTTVVPLIRDEITIGRKEGNTIRLTERNVSRRHARILRNNGEVQIEDLGSYNGIRVNNARIAERVSLRVSDQVQIGDYKLYLKAEGAEQVDDARTVPIERLEAVPPTEQMAAVAPTAQIPVTAPAAAAAAAAATAPTAQRAQLAVADTDPAGRPVATAAQVAALSQTPTFGKLVCVSSNFAGKEWELTRSHMVIGRTDDNDIIINHRSISRNNVRITRDPQSGRYTITDVGSSNGVRVNGQEYKNVELRRGDLVDLGHVRLRFVEPGEDFVFSRDAQITDVADTGGRRGLLVAIILSVLVLGAAGAYLAFRNNGGGGDDNKHGDNGSNTQIASTNPPTSGSGSAAEPDGSATQPVPKVETIDAGVATPPGNDPLTECKELKADKKWQELLDCTQKLSGPDVEGLRRTAMIEQPAELAYEELVKALKPNSRELTTARKQFERIPDESVYRADAKKKYDAAVRDELDNNWLKKANAFRKQHKCPELELLKKQASNQVPEISDEVHAVACSEVVAQNPDRHPKDPGNGSGSGSGGGSGGTQTLPSSCDAAKLAKDGKDTFTAGDQLKAIKLMEQAIGCGASSADLIPSLYIASCNTKDPRRIEKYFKALPPSKQAAASQACLRNHLDPATGAKQP